MMMGMLRSILLDYIYKQGWGRIGIFKRKGINYLELECKKEHEMKLKKYAKTISELLDRTLKISLVSDYVAPKFGNSPLLPEDVRYLVADLGYKDNKWQM